MSSVQTVKHIGVFVAASAGIKPVLADYDPDTHAVAWSVEAGSGTWEASFVSDLSRQERYLKDISMATGVNLQVEIWEIDPEFETTDAGFQKTILFWGEFCRRSITLEGSKEQETLYAKMERFHFGEPIIGQNVRMPDMSNKTFRVQLEFNPQVDLDIVNNRFIPDGHTDDNSFWIDTQSVRTAAAIAYQAGDVSEWTVKDMLFTLCDMANDSQTLIVNPTMSEIEEIVETPPKVRNINLEVGHYLPHYLDNIAQRFGYNWVVDVRKTADHPEGKPIIRVYEQQKGTEKTVRMQAPNDQILDFVLSNTSGARVSFDTSTLANIIEGTGALIEREMTIPLYRTWPESEDGEEDHEDPNNYHGRKWAAGEGADYIEDPPRRAEITAPPDFSDDEHDWIIKRRVIQDCLTYQEDEKGVRRPPYVSYRENNTAEWMPVPNEWGYRVLTTEIGVWFTGQREPEATEGGIPDELLTADVELRITGTLQGDERLVFKTPNSYLSPNTNDVQQCIDLSDRFFDRKRVTEGEFESIFGSEYDERDDAEDLQEYIEKSADQSDRADVQASLTLFGLVFPYNADGSENADGYRIGDVITKIEGREISFQRGLLESQYDFVQVTGISWNNTSGNQSTVLTVTPHGVMR